MRLAFIGRAIFSFDVDNYPSAGGEILDFTEWNTVITVGTWRPAGLSLAGVVGHQWKATDFHSTNRPIPDHITQFFYAANAGYRISGPIEVFAEAISYSDEKWQTLGIGLVLHSSKQTSDAAGYERFDFPNGSRSGILVHATWQFAPQVKSGSAT
ncbi:MAG: hypothetical protein ACREJQ_06590 [bacterium]